MPQKVALHTLGCKLNFSETSTIGNQFLKNGFQLWILRIKLMFMCSIPAQLQKMRKKNAGSLSEELLEIIRKLSYCNRMLCTISS